MTNGNQSGWIEEVPGPQDGDPRRRYYRIAGPGKSALQHEIGRMEALLRKAKTLRLRLAESNS